MLKLPPDVVAKAWFAAYGMPLPKELPIIAAAKRLVVDAPASLKPRLRLRKESEHEPDEDR